MPKEPAASPFEQWVMGKPTLPLYWVAQPVVKNYPNGHLQAKDCDYRDIPTWYNCSPEQERVDADNDVMDLWLSGYFVNLSAVEEPPGSLTRCRCTSATSPNNGSLLLAVIPGSLTKLLQTLNISVNRCFKAELQVNWENWMTMREKSFIATGWMRRASYSTICQWVLEAWNAVPDTAIINGSD